MSIPSINPAGKDYIPILHKLLADHGGKLTFIFNYLPMTIDSALLLHSQTIMKLGISFLKSMKGENLKKMRRRATVNSLTAVKGRHDDGQEAELQGARMLTHAIIAQAYADVKRYWKYLLSQSHFAWKPYHRIVQENYLRREYDKSIDFFTKPYAGRRSYMEYLLSLSGEEATPCAGMVETVLRLKNEIERLSLGSSQTIPEGPHSELLAEIAHSAPSREQLALR